MVKQGLFHNQTHLDRLFPKKLEQYFTDDTTAHVSLHTDDAKAHVSSTLISLPIIHLPIKIHLSYSPVLLATQIQQERERVTTPL